MDVAGPTHCRPEAFDRFRDAVADLSEPTAMVRAATAIAHHELGDTDPEEILAELDGIAGEVQFRIVNPSPPAHLAHLHAVLFDELSFRGNAADYYNPLNSYLPVVLKRKTGIPITLGLIYREVGRRIGLTMRGIGAPGHFLLEVEGEGKPFLVDPFFGGRVLSREEALLRVSSITGLEIPPGMDPFPPADDVDWLARMLGNLRAIFGHQGREEDVFAMRELRALL